MKRLERLSYYEVEAIVDSKPDELGNPLYLVKWKNWPPETNTWEPVKHLSTVKSLIKDFHNAQNALPAQPVPAGEVVKRKRGRPRIIREPVVTDAKTQAIVETVNKADGLASIVEENTHPVIESVPDEPAIKLEEVQSHKDNKKKPIRKLHRATLRPLTLPFPQHKLQHRNEELSKPKEADKERQSNKEEKDNGQQKAVLVGDTGEEGKEGEQVGLQRVLLQCLNYTGVKVSFKNRTFYYQIPFLSEGRQQSVTVTASEIIKVNQRWFEGFFQGFYL